MATKKFSELTVLDTVNANLVLTVIPVYDTSSGTTRKVTLQQINDSIEANIPFAAAAFTQANTPSHVANSASNYANAAFLKANTANTLAQAAYDYANTIVLVDSWARDSVNSSSSYGNSAFAQANTANINSTSAGEYANAAFAAANSASSSIDSWARDVANAASSYANSSYSQANTANILAQAAFDQANTGGGLTANSVATLNNKTFDVSISSNNQFLIQGQSITSYSGSGQVVILQNSPTISILNLSDSELNLDGGSGSLYWSGQSGVAQAGDLKAGVYSSNSLSNNSLFTFGGAGANNMSVSVEGSLFVGTALPSNDGGLNTTFPGWLVVQSGGKFGGDIDTLGGLTLYGNIYSTSACSSINFVANSSGDGANSSTIQLVPDGNLTGTDQYLIIDPTAPGHIHIRAGGIQDGSSADLFLGGENTYFKVPAGSNGSSYISANSNIWQFGNDGSLTFPDISIQNTAFTSTPILDKLSLNGLAYEKFETKQDATGVVNHDCANASIFYHTSPDSNFTVNLQNLGLLSGRATSITLVIAQGGTAYIANTIQIAGASQTIKWSANTEPTGNANAIDIQSFSIFNNSGTYTVFGQLSTFG